MMGLLAEEKAAPYPSRWRSYMAMKTYFLATSRLKSSVSFRSILFQSGSDVLLNIRYARSHKRYK
jgi:hypothetical protein